MKQLGRIPPAGDGWQLVLGDSRPAAFPVDDVHQAGLVGRRGLMMTHRQDKKTGIGGILIRFRSFIVRKASYLISEAYLKPMPRVS